MVQGGGRTAVLGISENRNKDNLVKFLAGSAGGGSNRASI